MPPISRFTAMRSNAQPKQYKIYNEQNTCSPSLKCKERLLEQFVAMISWPERCFEIGVAINIRMPTPPQSRIVYAEGEKKHPCATSLKRPPMLKQLHFLIDHCLNAGNWLSHVPFSH